jgi:hypothetical protein
MYSVDRLDKGMIYILPGVEWVGGGFHHITQKDVQQNLCNVYFWNFPLKIFRLQWSIGN